LIVRADGVGEERGKAGPLCGLAACALWVPMALLVPALPALDDPAQVSLFWSRHSAALRWTVAAAVAGYPFLLVFLSDLQRRAEHNGSRLLARATVANAVVFVTALNIALGLAAAAGLLFGAAPTAQAADAALGYQLHVAAFVLAAPAAGPGTGLFVLLGIALPLGSLVVWTACASIAWLLPVPITATATEAHPVPSAPEAP
jgi:hypothetical protein